MSGNFVYVIRYEPKLHKVGFSKDPNGRIAMLQASDLRRLELVRTWHRPVGDAVAVEARAHKTLAEWRDTEPSFRERFCVHADVACAAVDFAATVIDAADVNPIRGLPLSVSRPLAQMSEVPIRPNHMGYLAQVTAEMAPLILAMRAEGVDPDSIHTNLTAMAKDLREGDVLFVSFGDAQAAVEIAARKGAQVRVLA